MRYVKFFIVIALLAVFTLFIFASSSEAGPKTEAALKAEVRSAQRAVERAEARLSEARHVLSAFRTYREHYGTTVARWVWLANDVGWPRSDWGQLLYIINRESRGYPNVTNPSSGAAGLLQFMPQWYNGEWSLPAFNPYNAEENLTMGLRLRKQQGWTPWAL